MVCHIHVRKGGKSDNVGLIRIGWRCVCVYYVYATHRIGIENHLTTTANLIPHSLLTSI